MQNQKPESNQQSSPSQIYLKKYLVIISIVFCLTILGVFWGFISRANFLIREQLLKQARAYSQEITLTREWIADQGGVYVKKQEGLSENPYLKDISSVKTRIVDQDNEVYFLKNPAMITREISEMALEERMFSFHITSLNPINPQNKPDEFEKKALKEFQAGTKNEMFQLETSEHNAVFRYIIPLPVKESCLQCHEAQGYRVGDIRGGISVSIPASDIIAEIRSSNIYIVAFALSVLLALTIVILLLSNQLISALKSAEARLHEMATRDFLTGLLNRREGMHRFREEISKSRRSLQPLSAILLDIDHFKNINDTYGHLVGDKLLQHLAENLIPALRDYDIFCRYGGEEFLLILPNTPLLEGVEIAERLRRKIAEFTFVSERGITITMTISLGVAQLTGNEDENSLVYRVDQALYGAKDMGRNRVNFLEKF